MLTLKELKQALILNEAETNEALYYNNTERLLELSFHRALIKDLIITQLEFELCIEKLQKTA